VRYSRGNRLGHVAPTGADAAAPSGRSGKRGAGPEAWLMKDLAWAWNVLKHLLRDLRKPSWIVAHFAKKDRHISLQYVRHCRQKWESTATPLFASLLHIHQLSVSVALADPIVHCRLGSR
jgi:hypothetical protein